MSFFIILFRSQVPLDFSELFIVEGIVKGIPDALFK